MKKYLTQDDGFEKELASIIDTAAAFIAESFEDSGHTGRHNACDIRSEVRHILSLDGFSLSARAEHAGGIGNNNRHLIIRDEGSEKAFCGYLLCNQGLCGEVYLSAAGIFDGMRFTPVYMFSEGKLALKSLEERPPAEGGADV